MRKWSAVVALFATAGLGMAQVRPQQRRAPIVKARPGGAPTVVVSGAPAGANCQRYTVGNAALTAAGATQNVTVFTLPARGKITGLTIKEPVQFTGGGITGLTVSLGRAGSETEYAPGWNLMQPVSDTNLYDDGGHFSATMAAHAVVARFTATGANLGNGTVSNLTAGSVDIWACSVTLP